MRGMPLASVACALFVCAVSVLGATPTATPTAAVIITAAPTTAAPLTPAPPLDSDVSRLDLIFSYFAQDTAAVAQYSAIIAATVNVTTRRIQFESSGSRIGYLFGNNVRVRITIQPPSMSEYPEVHPAAYIRAALVGLATNGPDSRLANIGVLSGESVDSLVAYEYSVFTAWDLLWTLLIVAGGLLFVGFFGFVAFRFYSERRMAKVEARLEKKRAEAENESDNVARRAAGAAMVAGAKPIIYDPNKKDHVQILEFDDDHDDGNIDPNIMNQLVESIAYAATRADSTARSQGRGANDSASPARTDGGSDASSPRNGRGGGATSEAFTAPTDRAPGADQSRLGPTTANGRELSAHVAASPPRQQRSAVESFLESISLPPLSGAGAPATAARPPSFTTGSGAPGTPRHGPTSMPPSALRSSNASNAAAGLAQRRVRLEDADL